MLHTSPGSSIILGTDNEGDRLTVVVEGGTGGGNVSPSLVGDIVDSLAGAARSIKDFFGGGCTPVTITTVNVGPDGKVTSVTTTTSCKAA
jgi:hypothetical protein